MEAIVTKGTAVIGSLPATGAAVPAPAPAEEPAPVRVGDGPVRVIQITAERMFLDIPPDATTGLPRYRGDLLLIEHSAGSITSQAVEVTRSAEGSTFVQTIRLSAGDAGNRVEFANAIEWRTAEANLKATFELTASNPKATYNWDIGTVERGNDHAKQFEVPSAPLSVPVALPFDQRVASPDRSVSAGAFDSAGRSLPAEMLPVEIAFGAVRFALAPPDTRNALAARGQALPLPAGAFTRVYLLAAADGEQEALAVTVTGEGGRVRPVRPLYDTLERP